MHGYSYWARVGNESPLARRHLREWAMLLDEWMRGTVARTRAAVARLTRHMAGVASDKGFLVGFVILFLLYFFVLLVQPSGVGRGGR
jgi:hypothetical protein